MRNVNKHIIERKSKTMPIFFVRAQSIAEYGILIMVVAAAVASMSLYVRRTVEGNMKTVYDQQNVDPGGIPMVLPNDTQIGGPDVDACATQKARKTCERKVQRNPDYCNGVCVCGCCCRNSGETISQCKDRKGCTHN